MCNCGDLLDTKERWIVAFTTFLLSDSWLLFWHVLRTRIKRASVAGISSAGTGHMACTYYVGGFLGVVDHS